LYCEKMSNLEIFKTPMITKTIPIHFCDYCRKYYIRKHACEKHEKYCRLNPTNNHKCFTGCYYLERYKKEGHITVFNCKKKNQLMYSYIAERINHQHLYDDEFIRMPLKCKDHTYFIPDSELTIDYKIKSKQ